MLVLAKADMGKWLDRATDEGSEVKKQIVIICLIIFFPNKVAN